jgi:hypothetical protein
MNNESRRECPCFFFIKLSQFLIMNLLKDRIEQLDPRHRTPIQLAVCLGRVEAARLLAQNDADCGIVSKDGWNCKLLD